MTAPSSPSQDPFVERLAREVEQWQRERLLQPDQAQALLARYGLVPGETPRTLRRSRVVQVLSVLGVILVAVGVILLIGANWQQMPRWTRLALVICATAGSYHAGYTMAYRSRRLPRVGMALLLLGSLLWGASIFLVGQMYHLGGGGGEKAAVGYWFIGVAPLAYVLASPLHMGLSLAIGTVWLILVAGGLRWPPQAYAAATLALGILFYAVGRLHSGWRAVQRLDASYGWFGLVYIVVPLYAFSFRAWWGIDAYLSDMSASYRPWLIAFLAAGAAAILALWLTRRRDRAGSYEALALACLVAVCIVAGMQEWTPSVPAGVAAPRHFPSAPLWPAALCNLLLLAAEIGLIAMGWARNQPSLVTFGLFVFFVQVLTRYFDLLGGMLSGGLMFIGAGLLLVIGGVVLERSRRRLLQAMAVRRTT
jgi:hypothetical protein